MSTITTRRGAVVAALLALVVLATGCRVIAYDLAPEPQRYQMTLDQRTGVSTVHTSWEFVSAHVAEDDTPAGTICFGNWVPELGLSGPCEAEPLIFLSYEFGLALDNTARAGRPHTIAVTGYYEDGTNGLEVTELTAWASYDDGAEWAPVDVEPTGPGTFDLSLRHPGLDRTSGSVALRVRAEDGDGNTVEQTIQDAYALRR
ncbi:hypothetical protein [Jiangella muralis]|uniref:hypothetical protein n=1 Tax=Jiangella muralis TaxID=702383 RepID=UPI00069E4BF2|nr:hypothetical protein [Jiangella muralis]